jgi:hypothetical protein
MTGADGKELSAMLTRVYLTYSRDFPGELLLVWFDALRGYELEDISAALNRHIADPDAGRFLPKPADVIAHLGGGNGVRAMAAWSIVERAVRTIGQWTSVCFDDPIIHRCIDDMGGWAKLATTETVEDLKFRGIEFGKRYQGFLVTGGVDTDYAPYLVGLAQAQNAHEGRGDRIALRFIGDVEKCKAVMQAAQGSGTLRVTDAMVPANSALPAPALKLVGGKKQ